ncbi:hypothetical protein GCM10028783_12240 [Modestobacter muralis]
MERAEGGGHDSASLFRPGWDVVWSTSGCPLGLQASTRIDGARRRLTVLLDTIAHDLPQETVLRAAAASSGPGLMGWAHGQR